MVYITYYPHYKDTEDANAILGTFCTTDAHNDRVNYFVNEFFGTLVLVVGALCCLSLPWGEEDHAAASIVVGFIVWGLVTSMGGPTGPGLNPARDFMPRLLHEMCIRDRSMACSTGTFLAIRPITTATSGSKFMSFEYDGITIGSSGPITDVLGLEKITMSSGACLMSEWPASCMN